MKRFFRFMLFACVALCAGMVASCSEDDTEPVIDEGKVSMALELVSTESSGATLKLTTKGIMSYAYMVSDEMLAEAPIPVVVFNSGEVAVCNDGDNEFRITGCKPGETYTAYVAGMSADAYHETVLTVQFTTTDVSDVVNVLDVYHDGYSVFVNVPAEVKERGNVLRCLLTDFAMYTYLRAGEMGPPREDASQLMDSGMLIDGDSKLFEYNNDNIYVLDENGNPVTNEDGDFIANHLPIVPNEPTVLILGEFTRSLPEHEHYGEWMTPYIDKYVNGSETASAYANAPAAPMAWNDNGTYYDDRQWVGFHSRTFFQTKAPEKLDAKLNVSVKNVGAVRATISINPDEAVKKYTVMVLSQDMKDQLMPWLGNDESLMQWLTTSYFGFNICYSQSETNGLPMDYVLENNFVVYPEQKWYAYVVGYGDDLGATQCFEVLEFSTTGRTKPAPAVSIEQISAPEGSVDSPYEVWFRIKCTTGDAVSGYYAADYVAEWGKALNVKDMSPSLLLQQGNPLSATDLAYMNEHADGLVVSFPTLPGMTTRLGILVMNDENTTNDTDSEGATDWYGDATASQVPDRPRVESELFDVLEGDWTLTATAIAKEYVYTDENPLGEWQWVTYEDLKTKVTISNGIDYPEVLPEEVYDVYANLPTPKDKAAVDKLYQEFRELADDYSERLRGQNRLLCVGFNSANEEEMLPMSAFEGFYRTDYNSYDNASIFYDFGPKWYLEIDRRGQVAVPFNYLHYAPMSNWTGIASYMAGVSETFNARLLGEDGSNDQYFPVEVSEDRNTITIKPFEATSDGVTEPFYPNALYYDTYSGYSITQPTYITELVLTRGWNEPEAEPASLSNVQPVYANPVHEMLQPVQRRVISRTKLENMEVRETRTIRSATPEEAKANLKALVEKRYGIRK